MQIISDCKSNESVNKVSKDKVDIINELRNNFNNERKDFTQTVNNDKENGRVKEG